MSTGNRTNPMEINEAGLDIIKYWERNPRTGTFYPDAYRDSEGVWTIGWGTIRWDMRTPVKRGDTITEEEADKQLRKEVQRIEDAINSSVRVELSSNEFSALCSLFYNIGIGWCTGKGHAQATLIKRLNRGDYNVANEFLKFRRGAVTGRVYNGLINRRKQEAKLWLTPDIDESALAPVAVSSAPGTPADEVEEAMPQAVSQAPENISESVRTSWTIRGAVAALVGGVVQAWDWVFSTAQEAGAEITAIKGAAGPFEALFTALKANATGIAAAIVIIGCAVAIVRRIQAAREGKIG